MGHPSEIFNFYWLINRTHDKGTSWKIQIYISAIMGLGFQKMIEKNFKRKLLKGWTKIKSFDSS